MLRTDLIYLSNPHEFNDPYEGDILYESKNVYEDFKKRIVNSYIANPNSKLSNEKTERILNSNDSYVEMLRVAYEADFLDNKSISFDEFQKIMLEIPHSIVDEFFSDSNNIKKMTARFACFSESKLINPMWAHYAENHKGICIEYNLKDLDEIFLSKNCYPISYVKHNDYTKELLQLRDKSFSDFFKLNEEPFLKKSIDWKYEKEWRIKLTMGPANLNFIKKINSKYFIKISKPKAVFLGLKIEKDYENKIRKICEDREISLFKMVKDGSKYNLCNEKIFDFPVGKLDDINHIRNCIEKGALKNLLYFYFFDSITGSVINNPRLILKSFENLSSDKITSFLDEILFKKKYNPVLPYYYKNVLTFFN